MRGSIDSHSGSSCHCVGTMGQPAGGQRRGCMQHACMVPQHSLWHCPLTLSCSKPRSNLSLEPLPTLLLCAAALPILHLPVLQAALYRTCQTEASPQLCNCECLMCYMLKRFAPQDIEKIASKRGVVLQSVKEVRARLHLATSVAARRWRTTTRRMCMCPPRHTHAAPPAP